MNNEDGREEINAENVVEYVKQHRDAIDGTKDHPGLRDKVKRLDSWWWTVDRLGILIGLIGVIVAIIALLN